MNKKETICFVNGCFYPHLGGVERYTLQLSKKLILLGYNVVVLTTNTNKTVYHEVIDGITVFRLPIFNTLGSRYPILKINNLYFKIIKEILQLEIDFFVINTRFYITSLLGLYISKKKQKEAIVIEHGTGHFTINNKLFDFLGRSYEHLITRIIKSYHPKFYGVSIACNNWLKHFNITASGTFYNGIDTSYKILTQTNILKHYKIPNNALIVSYAGRLIDEKGVLVLIKALKKISELHKDIYFFFAGSGSLSHLLIELETEYPNVFYMGAMKYDNLMNMLVLSDILVNPSYYPEGLPTIILEAGAHGCAIIATPQGGTEEVIIDKDYGIIISPQNSDEIINAILKLYNDRRYLDLISKNIKVQISKKFDWNFLALNFIKELKQQN